MAIALPGKLMRRGIRHPPTAVAPTGIEKQPVSVRRVLLSALHTAPEALTCSRCGDPSGHGLSKGAGPSIRLRRAAGFCAPRAPALDFDRATCRDEPEAGGILGQQCCDPRILELD